MRCRCALSSATTACAASDTAVMPAALGLQLLQARAQLLRHVVERMRKHRELVAPADGDAAFEISLRHRVRGADESSDGAHYRASLEPSDDADEQQAAEEKQQEAV